MQTRNLDLSSPKKSIAYQAAMHDLQVIRAAVFARQKKSGNFSVLIDTNCGFRKPDWQVNSEPQALASALSESSELRASGWISRLVVAK